MKGRKKFSNLASSQLAHMFVIAAVSTPTEEVK